MQRASKDNVTTARQDLGPLGFTWDAFLFGIDNMIDEMRATVTGMTTDFALDAIVDKMVQDLDWLNGAVLTMSTADPRARPFYMAVYDYFADSMEILENDMMARFRE